MASSEKKPELEGGAAGGATSSGRNTQAGGTPHRGWARLGEIVFPVRGRVLIPAYAVFLFVWWNVTAHRVLAYGVGVTLVLGGLLLRAWSRRYMGRSSDAHVARAPRLVTGGPYRFSRNPLYVANLMQVAGMGFCSLLLWFVPVVVLLTALQYHAIVLYEEATLGGLWGEEYDRYRAATSRWLAWPRRPQSPLSSPVLSVRDTLHRERRIIAGGIFAVLILGVRAFLMLP
ncbi:MAG: isoprenylcysteine carboxylmethyltransferase family protein [Planctomycetota bacterium]